MRTLDELSVQLYGDDTLDIQLTSDDVLGVNLTSDLSYIVKALWGNITGDIENQQDLINRISVYIDSLLGERYKIANYTFMEVTEEGVTMSFLRVTLDTNDPENEIFINLATMEAVRNTAYDLLNRVETTLINYPLKSELSQIAFSGDIKDAIQTETLILDCGTSTQVV